ncbi:MAG: OsmC family protein [Chloroflexota bacterium]
MSNVALKWMGGQSRLFVTRDTFGNVVSCGSWPEEEDPNWQEFKAAKPSDMLLMSLSSCSAYDVVSILQRQRQNLSGLYINVDGTQNSEPPYEFTDIHLHFMLEGEVLIPPKFSVLLIFPLTSIVRWRRLFAVWLSSPIALRLSSIRP